MRRIVALHEGCYFPTNYAAATFPLAGAAIDLDLANNRIYPSGAFTDYLSCSRASIGYVKNSGGTLTQFSSNVLRIGVGTGLLVEDARTNLILQSTPDLTNSVWTKGNITSSNNAIAAPDGTTTATSITDDTTNSFHAFFSSSVVSITSGATVSLSCYAKAGTRDKIYVMAAAGTGFFGAVFDLSNGTLGETKTDGTIGTLASTSIETLASGYYRCTVVGSLTGKNFCTPNFEMAPLATGNTFSGADVTYAGTTQTLYVWGCQLEEVSFPSSYIPTTTSATRAADVVTNAGTLQTDIAAATGSIVVKINNGEVAGLAANIVDSNGTNLLGFDASNHGLASITATLTTTNTANRTSRDKLGIAWDGFGRRLVLNGGTVATDANAQTPNSTQHLGSSGTDNFAYAYIERLTVWTSKLASATLQGFTT